MKPRAFKFIFFITIIILIMIAVFIIYKDKNKSTVRAEGRKIDNVITNNINIGLVGFDSINPHISLNQDVQHVSKLVFKELIGINKEFELVASLAKEWSKISPNVYIIKLNENQYWHNGKKFTAKDVEFTINELKKDTSNSIYKGNVKNIEKVEIIDNNTIKIYTYEEETFFEYNLCFPILCSSSENNINGTGNYEVVEMNSNYILLEEANKSDVPKKIKVNLYNNYSELYSAFSQEKVDIITTSNTEFNNYVGTIGLSEEKIKGRELTYLKINTLQDINIRKAINFSINKDEIIYNVFNSKYFSANSPLDNGNYLGQANIINGYNLNNAKKYIMASGWKYNNEAWVKNGNILNIDLSVKQSNENDIKIAQELKKQIEKIGIKINIVELSDDIYNYILENNNYEMIICNDTLPIFPDMSKYLNMDDIETNKMLNEIGNIENKEVLKKAYNEILEKYKEENRVICLSFNSIIILHNSNVKGDFTGNWYNIFYNIDTWYKEL